MSDDCGMDHFKPGKLRLATARTLLRLVGRILPGFSVMALSPCVVESYHSRQTDLIQRALLASMPASELGN